MASAFNPELITNPRLNPKAAAIQAPIPDQAVPIAPEPTPTPVPQVAPVIPPKPIILPVPVPVKAEKPKSMMISPDVARKAQGIYPAEQQAKQNMIENAKSPPAPLGAWGKPK